MIPDEPPPVSVHGRDEATLTQAALNPPSVPRTPRLQVLPGHRHPSARFPLNDAPEVKEG